MVATGSIGFIACYTTTGTLTGSGQSKDSLA